MYITVFLLFILILLCLIINCYSFILLKWNNDYSASMEKLCNDLNISELEYETYRHNIYRFLYGIDNDNYKNSIKLFKITYYIIISLISLILIAYIRNLRKLEIENLFILFSYLTFYVLYIYIGNKIISNYDSLNNMLVDDNSDILKYAKVYKILNAIMYINNFNDNTLGFSDINIKHKKFNNILTTNISTYENIENTAKITELKRISYNNLDFIKYITLDSRSPYYLKDYFNKIYINTISDDYQHKGPSDYGPKSSTIDIKNNLIKAQVDLNTAITALTLAKNNLDNSILKKKDAVDGSKILKSTIDEEKFNIDIELKQEAYDNALENKNALEKKVNDLTKELEKINSEPGTKIELDNTPM